MGDATLPCTSSRARMRLTRSNGCMRCSATILHRYWWNVPRGRVGRRPSSAQSLGVAPQRDRAPDYSKIVGQPMIGETINTNVIHAARGYVNAHVSRGVAVLL